MSTERLTRVFEHCKKEDRAAMGVDGLGRRLENPIDQITRVEIRGQRIHQGVGGLEEIRRARRRRLRLLAPRRIENGL